MDGLNAANLFRMDCADCRAAIGRFHRGQIEADQLIAALRRAADIHPALRPLATNWLRAERLGLIDGLSLPPNGDLALWEHNLTLLTEEMEWHPGIVIDRICPDPSEAPNGINSDTKSEGLCELEALDKVSPEAVRLTAQKVSRGPAAHPQNLGLHTPRMRAAHPQNLGQSPPRMLA